jgi:drug/metabolite transporter (DMT)-like permease
VSPRALLFAIGGGIGIGAFFAIIALAPKDAGLWPVVFARGTSSTVFLLVALVLGLRGVRPLIPVRRAVRVEAVSAGVLDVTANAIYLVATQIGLLSVVAVLGSLYPAATVLLARFVLAERLRPMQKVGMVTAIVAAALLAIGS